MFENLHEDGNEEDHAGTQKILDEYAREQHVRALLSPTVLNAVAIPLLKAAAGIQPMFGDEWNNGVTAALASVDPFSFSMEQKGEILAMFSEGEAQVYVAADLAERTGDLAFFFPHLVALFRE
ncbi:hypothetical protein HZA42_05080 [Candidatus Peregrinibacteria bacterium]|nr:hypothetical protein [Candidatus Peregrinibacteria bacterium]